MTNIDLELITFVFFWVGLWGAIQTVSEWLFEQMGEAYNPGTRFLYYIVLAFGALCIINYLLEKRFDDTDEEDDDTDDIG